MVGSTRSLDVSRPWVSRQKVAWKIAASIGRQSALPYLAGSIRVKKSAAAGLEAGSLFRLTYAPSNLDGVLCRVLEKTNPGPGSAEVTIQWREDRGYLNANLADVSDDPSLTEETFGASAPHAVRILELPFAYRRSFDPWVMFLVARGDRVSTGFNGYVETSIDSYDQIGVGQVFALRGALQAEFPASVLREDEHAELDVSFDSPDRTLESVAYANALGAGPMRIFVGDEVMLGYTATLVSAGRYRLKVLRARFGSRRRAHAVGAEVFVLVMGQTQPLAHEVAWNPSVATARFKVQPQLHGPGPGQLRSARG